MRATLTLSTRQAAGIAANFYAKDRRVAQGIRRVTKQYGELTRDLVQFLAPKDTWFMTNHVRVKYGPKGFTFEVGWDENDFSAEGLPFYPIYQEFGTRFAAAQPSLFPAIQSTRPEYLAALSKELSNAIRRRERAR